MCILFVLFSLSCKDKSKIQGDEKPLSKETDVFIRQIKFPVTYNLEGEVVPLDILKPTSFVVVDSFFVVGEDNAESQMFIFNRNTLELLVSLFPKGDGPDDIILMAPIYQWGKVDNELEVWINSLYKYHGALNINKTVAQNKPVFNTKYVFNQYKKTESPIFVSNHKFALKDSSFYLSMDLSRSGSIRHNINKNIVNYDYKTDKMSEPFYVTNYKWEKISQLLMACDMGMRADEAKIAVGYRYFNQLVILDMKTKSRIYITQEPDFFTVEEAHNKQSNKSQFYYSYVAVTDHLIFALNQKDKVNTCHFDVFDWEGKPVCQLRMPGIFYSPFIDSETKMIYVLNENFDIWSFKLDVINQAL